MHDSFEALDRTYRREGHHPTNLPTYPDPDPSLTMDSSCPWKRQIAGNSVGTPVARFWYRDIGDSGVPGGDESLVGFRAATATALVY
jgi:hypothetical protein